MTKVPEKNRTAANMIDPIKLGGFLRDNVTDFAGEADVVQVAGGQSNPTFIVTAGANKYVLRAKPQGKLLKSAHAIDREFRVMGALHASDVPVPNVRIFCEDPTVLGSAFYIMDFVDGRIFGDQTLPGFDVAERRAMYEDMNRVIALLHGVDYKAIGLQDFGRDGNFVQRQVDLWTRQYRAAETRSIEEMEQLIRWLPDHIPPQGETSIVHGDFRLDNVIFHKTEPRIIAVLDWELSTLGDPLVDFAYHCMTWRLQLATRKSLVGINLEPLGIPNEAQHVANYCRRTGRDHIANWDFYMAFNMFRLAAIQQGIAKRFLDGNAAHPRAGEVAAAVQSSARAGWAAALQAQC